MKNENDYYSQDLLKYESLVKSKYNTKQYNMIMDIAKKACRFKLSSRQLMVLERAYYGISEKIATLEKEARKKEENKIRRSKLSQFELLWEDNCSKGYREPDVGWGSGEYEYMCKEQFKKIYDKLNNRIKQLEREHTNSVYGFTADDIPF